MNDINHTHRGGHESQAPDTVDLSLPDIASSASLWNSPIGRRAFLKKTGAATVATAVAMHGFRVQVQAQATGGTVRIWTQYQHSGDPLYPTGRIIGTGVKVDANATQAQVDAAKAAAKEELNNVMKEIANAAPDFVPGVTQGLAYLDHFDDNAAGYKAGFKVEVNGVAMTDANIELVETTEAGTGKKIWTAKLKLFEGGKVKIWVRLPK